MFLIGVFNKRVLSLSICFDLIAFIILLESNKNNSKNVGISGKLTHKTMMTKLVKNFPMLTKCIVKWTITKLQEILPSKKPKN